MPRYRHPTRKNVRTPALVAAATLALAACGSTTQEDSNSPSAYPEENSPGLSDSSITIGLFGFSEPYTGHEGETDPNYLALDQLIADKNAQGGIDGLQIDPVWVYDGRTGDEPDAPAINRNACDHAVRQHQSFATQVPQPGDFASLLVQTGCVGPIRTVNIVSDQIVTAGDMTENPDVVAPYALDDVTAGHVLAEQLDQQGFFDGAGKVAVLNPTGQFADSAKDVVAADLEAAGVQDPLVITGGADTEAEVASLVLRLKTEDVDRIVFFDNYLKTYFLIQAMVDQKYTPPIGTLYAAQPNWWHLFYGYPVDQISAVSWLGQFEDGEDPSVTISSLPDMPATDECVNAQQATGAKPSEVSRLLTMCDTLALIQAALEAADSDQPSTAAFYDGLSELTEFDSAFGITLDFSDGRTGASQVWDFQGDEACQCLKAAGPYPIGPS